MNLALQEIKNVIGEADLGVLDPGNALAPLLMQNRANGCLGEGRNGARRFSRPAGHHRAVSIPDANARGTGTGHSSGIAAARVAAVWIQLSPGPTATPEQIDFRRSIAFRGGQVVQAMVTSSPA